jgi:hypothetical protein
MQGAPYTAKYLACRAAFQDLAGAGPFPATTTAWLSFTNMRKGLKATG